MNNDSEKNQTVIILKNVLKTNEITIGTLFIENSDLKIFIGEDLGSSLYKDFEPLIHNLISKNKQELIVGQLTNAPGIYKCIPDRNSIIGLTITLVEELQNIINKIQDDISDNFNFLSKEDVDKKIKNIDKIQKGIPKINDLRKQLIRGIIYHN